MSLSRYAIGLGQMPADEEGRCSSAVILYDPNTAKELIRLSYDTVGDILTGISDNPALAEQIAEAEKRGAERMRERCAAQCDALAAYAKPSLEALPARDENRMLWYGRHQYAAECAKAIRALPSQEPQG